MTKCFSLHKIAKGSATVKRHKAAHWPIEEFQFQQNEVNIQASYVTECYQVIFLTSHFVVSVSQP